MDALTATINWRGDWDACISGGSVTVDLVTDDLDDDYRETVRETLRAMYAELVGEPVFVMFSDETLDDEDGIVRKTEKPAPTGES